MRRINFRETQRYDDHLDALVAAGEFGSKSEAIRYAIRQCFDPTRARELRQQLNSVERGEV